MAPQREWFEKDYYEVLGIASDATDKDVSRAYRKLAKQFHPDANPGDTAAEERFKEISAAHEVLGDPEKRKEYDQVREMVAAGGGRGGFGGGGFGGGGFPGFDGATFHFDEGGGVGDLLGNLFGGGRGRARRGRGSAPRRGRDLEAELHLGFLDAVHGITTSVRLTSEAPCSTCQGTGARPGTLPDVCTACGGAGAVAVDQGPFSFSEVCPTCSGRGRVVADPCPQCRGRGIEVRPREVKVKVPAGVKDGQRIRVPGRGAPGVEGGPPGDLFVVVHVQPHPVFGRSGRHDLTITVPITYPEAVLGAKVKVPTLDDPVTVKVPPGTQSGKAVKVRGRGIQPAKGDSGDLLVRFEVAVPVNPSPDERRAVEALAGTMAESPREYLEV